MDLVVLWGMKVAVIEIVVDGLNQSSRTWKIDKMNRWEE